MSSDDDKMHTVTLRLSEREMAIICDALWTAGTSYAFGQDYERRASARYSELASQLNSEFAVARAVAT